MEKLNFQVIMKTLTSMIMNFSDIDVTIKSLRSCQGQVAEPMMSPRTRGSMGTANCLKTLIVELVFGGVNCVFRSFT